jgi:hypothetical protein
MTSKRDSKGDANKKVHSNAEYNRAAMNNQSMHSSLYKPNAITAGPQAGRQKTL